MRAEVSPGAVMHGEILLLVAARRLVAPTFAFAALYNCVAIFFGVAVQVTQLIAAVVMSASSILVVANAPRLNAGRASKPRLSATSLQDVSA